MTPCCRRCRSTRELLCSTCVHEGIRICETCERARDDIDGESTSCGECQAAMIEEQKATVLRSGD